MAVARLDGVAMFDLDIIAVAAEALGAADDAVGGRVDRGAVRRRNVDAIVARDLARDRVDAHAVRRRQRHLIDRAARRNGHADAGRQAGVETLPRLKNRAGFAVFARRNASGEAVVIGFVGSNDAGIGAGFGSLNGGRCRHETCCGAEHCDLMQLLRQKSVYQNTTPRVPCRQSHQKALAPVFVGLDDCSSPAKPVCYPNG